MPPMELDDYSRNFKTIPFEVDYFDKQGNAQHSTLNIKYRPVRESWINEWNALQRWIGERRSALDAQAMDILRRQAQYNKLPEVKNKKSKEAKERKKLVADLQKEGEALALEVENAKKEVAEKTAANLSEVILDLDITDKGQPVKITAEFLATLDLEFLQEIGELLGKRIARGQTA